MSIPKKRFLPLNLSLAYANADVDDIRSTSAVDAVDVISELINHLIIGVESDLVEKRSV
jgi:hypothetical protein